MLLVKALEEMPVDERLQYLQQQRLMEEMLWQGRVMDDVQHKLAHRTWWADFGSNVAGNAAWDGVRWIAKVLLEFGR